MKYAIFLSRAKKGIQLSLTFAILLFSFMSSSTYAVYASAPSNDDITGAKTIDQLTYLDGPFDLTEATQDPSDPDNITCTTAGTTETKLLNRGNNSVWYKYTPLVQELVAVNTIGSEYALDDDMDTYVAVWRGAPGSLTFVKCNDDNFVGQTSELTFRAVPGNTYYIEVANYNCEVGITNCGQQTGGTLVFNATISNTQATIANELKGSYYIPTGQSEKATYTQVNKGPVLVEGSLDIQPLVAALGVKYKQNGQFVSYSQMMGFPAVQATTEYYFPRYTTNANQTSQLRIANVGDQDTDVKIYIAGNLKQTISALGPGKAVQANVYTGSDNGPVRVVSMNPAVNIVTSMKVIYKRGGKNISYSELMGYPKDQLTNIYLFPRNINNTNIKSQLRVANVGTETTTIRVYINGALKKSFNLESGKAATASVSNSGIMRVVSTNPSVNIVAALRQIYYKNGIPVSYSEFMGYPKDQLTHSYAFPWYTNNASMTTKLYIANVGTDDATMEVYIGGDLKGSPFLLEKGDTISKSYSADDGPVLVKSTNDVNVLVSMQITYKPSGVPVSYAELMGYPYLDAQPTTSYWFPWYTTNSQMKSLLLFGYP